MMYFTETDATSCDNPVELNEEFEAQYDTAEYETKISRLVHHAYDRLKLEAPRGKTYLGPRHSHASQRRPLLSRIVGYQTQG